MIRKIFIKLIKFILKHLICTAIPSLIGGAMYHILAPFAYMERGYYALGGEFLVPVAIIVFGTGVCFEIWDKHQKARLHHERSRVHRG